MSYQQLLGAFVAEGVTDLRVDFVPAVDVPKLVGEALADAAAALALSGDETTPPVAHHLATASVCQDGIA